MNRDTDAVRTSAWGCLVLIVAMASVAQLWLPRTPPTEPYREGVPGWYVPRKDRRLIEGQWAFEDAEGAAGGGAVLFPMFGH